MTNEPSNQYKEDVKQAQSLTNLESDKCSQSLLDLCLSLNSRKLRLYRTLVLYVMTKEHRLFSEEDIQEAIKVVCTRSFYLSIFRQSKIPWMIRKMMNSSLSRKKNVVKFMKDGHLREKGKKMTKVTKTMTVAKMRTKKLILN